MKKIKLIKAAIDFVFENYQSNPIELAQKSIQAFIDHGGNNSDLQVWNQTVTQYLGQVSVMIKQKLPSEFESDGLTIRSAVVSNASAAKV